MRELTSHKVNGLNDALTILVNDAPGHGNACHIYTIIRTEDDKPLNAIAFQNGPIQETGVNGISQEALLAIIEDRLIGFQTGEYATRENAIALNHVQTAMMWLQKRTRDRIARGVEGSNQK